MKQLLFVFVGGGFGSVLRFVIAKWLNNTENGLPYGTFAANIIGSLLIGIILGLAAKNETLSQSQTLLLATGFCGGFTTFSTFARENVQFFKSGEPLHALTYVLASNIFGLTLVAVGFMISVRFLHSERFF